MRRGPWYCVVAVAIGARACVALGQQAPSAAVGSNASSSLTNFNNDIRALYVQTSASLVRLEIKQSAAAVLSPALKAKFDNWIKENGSPGPAGPGTGRNPGRGGGIAPATTGVEGRGGGRGRGDGGGQGSGGVSGFGRGPGTGGDRGGGGGGGLGNNMTNQVRSFLEQEARQNPADAAILRGLALKVELNRNGYQGELSALLLDNQGYALVPAGLIREAHPDPIKGTLPDGTPTTAKYIGSNLLSGFTIVQLNNVQGLKPAALARNAPAPGELLLSIGAGESNASLIVATNRVAGASDDRAGAFIFDVHGNVAAVTAGIGNGAFRQNNRSTVLLSRLQRESDYIIKNNKDIDPRAMGYGFNRLSENPARAAQLAPLLKGGTGIIVNAVDPKSLADKAGLKVGDVITSIDNRPLSEFVGTDGRPTQELLQFQYELTTRTGTVPLGIIRKDNGADKEQVLQMPLE